MPQKAKDKKHGRKEKFHGLQKKEIIILSAFSARSCQPHLCQCFRLRAFAQGHVILQIVSAKKNPAVFHTRLRLMTYRIILGSF